MEFGADVFDLQLELHRASNTSKKVTTKSLKECEVVGEAARTRPWRPSYEPGQNGSQKKYPFDKGISMFWISSPQHRQTFHGFKLQVYRTFPSLSNT